MGLPGRATRCARLGPGLTGGVLRAGAHWGGIGKGAGRLAGGKGEVLFAASVLLGLPGIRGSSEAPRAGRWTAVGGTEARRWSC